MVDFSKASTSSQKPVDKTVYNLSGQFTYTYNTSDSGGVYSIPNPEPGVIFLPDSIFSVDGGNTWFSDLDSQIGGIITQPELNTICTVNNIIFRWASYGINNTFTVLYATKLLAVS